MGAIVKEYDIPFLGLIQLIQSQPSSYEEAFNGKFYARHIMLGDVCVRCDSIEDLTEKLNPIIYGYLEGLKSNSELMIESEKIKISGLEKQLTESKEKNWLEKYHTKNSH